MADGNRHAGWIATGVGSVFVARVDAGIYGGTRAYASAVSFAAIVSAEWGDVGQITAAVLAAEHDALFIVWLGASLAMITKLVLAVSVGVGIRRWVPVAVVRVATTALCLAMAILAVVGVEP